MKFADVESVFAHWLAEFFVSRSMRKPDGRQLYAYHLTDAEFSELTRLLRSIGSVPIQVLNEAWSFKAAWFLFSAEWWKRSYLGGAWGWSGIFAAIPLQEPPQSTKQAWVMAARDYWRLAGYMPTGRPYLGLVIVNGGIPERLLEEAQGRVAVLLRLVLLRVGRLSPRPTGRAMADAVREQQHLLPGTYREESIFSLFAGIVDAVLELRTEFALSDAKNPLERLETRCPDWKSRFPLRLNGQAAARLLNGLVNDAVAASRGGRTLFSIKRGLRCGDGLSWTEVCEVDAGPRASLGKFAESLEISVDEVPQSFDIAVRGDGNIAAIGRGFVSGDDVAIRVERYQLPSHWFASSVTLELSRFGGLVHASEIPRGEAPDPTMPWVLSDSAPVAQLIKAGSARVRSPSVLVSVPRSATLAGRECQSEIIGESKDRILFRLTGGHWCIQCDNENYEISCGAPESIQEEFLWRGKRLYLDSEPPFVFVSRPELYRVRENGEKLSVAPSQIYWRPIGREGTGLPLARLSPASGIGYLRWIDDGKLQSRLKAVCLPENANVHYRAGVSPECGTILLKNWGAISSVALLEPPNVGVNVRNDADGNWELELAAAPTSIPANVTLQINWPGAECQRLVLPFPSKGVVLSDADGNMLPLLEQFQITDLVGARARLLSTNPDARWLLTLTLQRRDAGGKIERQIAYPRPSGQSALREVRLFELIPTISQMLASVETLDALVEARFTSEGRSFRAFRVGRYGLDVEPGRDDGVYRIAQSTRNPDLELLQKTRISALPLQRPDEEISLDAVESAGIKTGAWRFHPECRASGVWLIYPEVGAPLPLRPLAWFIPRDEAHEDSHTPLKKALAIADKFDRLDELATALGVIAEDPSHTDWTWIEALANRVGHLPLSSLDLWIAMSRVPKAMVMAHLRVDGFADKISPRVDKELPFEWALTSPIQWQLAVRRIKASSEQQEPTERMLADLLLQGRIQAASQLPALLKMSLNLAEHERMGRRMPELDLKPDHRAALFALFLESLFERDDSALQRLIRRPEAVQDVWPTDLKIVVQRFAETPSGTRLFSRLGGLRDDIKFSAIGLPLLLAYEVAAGQAAHWRNSPEELAALRNYRDFDSYWFDEAYQCGMQCALCEGLMRTEQ